MKKLYSFNWDCGRMGELDGLFIAEDFEVEKLIGEQVYFGEVLGKHSEVFGKIEEADIIVKSDDQDFIAKLIDLFGEGTISGYNPLEYFEDNDSDDIDDDEDE